MTFQQELYVERNGPNRSYDVPDSHIDDEEMHERMKASHRDNRSDKNGVADY